MLHKDLNNKLNLKQFTANNVKIKSKHIDCYVKELDRIFDLSNFIDEKEISTCFNVIGFDYTKDAEIKKLYIELKDDNIVTAITGLKDYFEYGLKIIAPNRSYTYMYVKKHLDEFKNLSIKNIIHNKLAIIEIILS